MYFLITVHFSLITDKENIYVYAYWSFASMANDPKTFTFSGTPLSSLGSAVTGQVVNLEHHQRQ